MLTLQKRRVFHQPWIRVARVYECPNVLFSGATAIDLRQSWVFIGRTDVEAETPILWPPDAKNQLIGKDPGAGKGWRQEEKRMTGWDGWMASLTQWTWVWVNYRSWWWTGRPGMLQSIGLQRVRHEWATELNWPEHMSSESPGASLLFRILHSLDLLLLNVGDHFVSPASGSKQFSDFLK